MRQPLESFLAIHGIKCFDIYGDEGNRWTAALVRFGWLDFVDLDGDGEEGKRRPGHAPVLRCPTSSTRRSASSISSSKEASASQATMTPSQAAYVCIKMKVPAAAICETLRGCR